MCGPVRWLTLSCFVLSCLVLSCQKPPAPWDREDLWFARPRLLTLTGEPAGQVQRITVPLGLREVRDLAQVSAWDKKQVPMVSAGEIHALVQLAGTRLVARFELGSDPFFSFIPLAHEPAPCACLYQVTVRAVDAATPAVTHRVQGQAAVDPPPATVDLKLTAFAGQTIELTLEITAPTEIAAPELTAPAPPAANPAEPAVALWGSPALYHRRAPVPSRKNDDPRPNVLLVGVDTLRARALGVYGRQPSLTPAIDRLASESDVFLHAFSAFNATNPSFSSILTGLYGKHHGVYDNNTRLAAESKTLAELFAAAGYATGAVLSARHLEFADLGRGFAEVSLSQSTFAGELPIDLILGWISAQDGPFFAWVHLFDPHTPHTPPLPYALGLQPATLSGIAPVASWREFRALGRPAFKDPVYGGHKDLYDSEVAYLDRQIDRLLDFLKSRHLHETTIVIFVADHGENLEEHGILYGHAGLWDTTVHVPLFIRWPGAAQGRQLPALVQTLDLFPTLLTAAGIAVPPNDGHDLKPIASGAQPGRRLVFAEHAGGKSAMVRTRTHKYFVATDTFQVQDGTYFYDLAHDPEETQNLSGQGASVEADLARVLTHFLAQRQKPGDVVVLSAEEEAQLRALGYL